MRLIMTKLTHIALSSTAAVALLAGATALSANAAPIGANLESLKTAAPVASENVQWRRGRNVAIGVGAFGLGVAAGAAIANNRGYYYDQPYGYYEQPYGYYEQPYGYYYGRSNGNQPGSYDNLTDVAR
jgi:hypothetical protein